jgi:hypothetical protein
MESIEAPKGELGVTGTGVPPLAGNQPRAWYSLPSKLKDYPKLSAMITAAWAETGKPA